MLLFFLTIIQYYLMKFCTRVLGVTLIITSTKNFFSSCSSLQGAILGILGPNLTYYIYFLKIVQYVLMKFCTDVLAVPFEGHYTVFSISWPCWGALVGIFGLILGNVLQILLNCLISSQETLYRCSWYNPDYH